MSGAYREYRQETGDHADTQPACRVCGVNAERATLSTYGGMCARCYGDYRRAGCHNIGPLSIDDKADPMAWATALQERHRRGDRLTHAQVKAYTAALKQRPTVPDDDCRQEQRA